MVIRIAIRTCVPSKLKDLSPAELRPVSSEKLAARRGAGCPGHQTPPISFLHLLLDRARNSGRLEVQFAAK